MKKNLLVILAASLVILPLAFYGCKGRQENVPEVPKVESAENATPMAENQPIQLTEPAQNVAVETIPPTAASQGVEKAPATPIEKSDRSRDIQIALAKAGFYSGAIDGKIGPRTKRAIEEFQKAKGLKVDGKVGPRTWAELEKYLVQ